MIKFSVIVATYNSARFIKSTLDSILWQSYPPSEIIITDDGSSDSTLKICKDWIEEHSDFCNRIELLEVKKNTGAVANYQRGYDAVSFECDWVKKLDGDDMLTPNCLKKYKEYIEHTPEAEVIASAIIPFCKDSDIEHLDESKFENNAIHYILSDKTVELQRKYFDYFEMFSLTPTLIIKRNVFEKVKNDTRIPMIGDVPFARNLLYNNFKIYYLPKATVFYRVVDSISHSMSRFFNPIFVDSVLKYRDIYPRKLDYGFWGCSIRILCYFRNKRLVFFYDTLNNTPKWWSRRLFNTTGKILTKCNYLLQTIYLQQLK